MLGESGTESVYQDDHWTRYVDPDYSDPSHRDPWQRPRVLAIDGGGAQGMWSLYVLQKLMHAIIVEESRANPPALSSTSSPLYLPVEDSNLRSISATEPDNRQLGQRFRPCHYFDYICGRNWGGIHALLLGVLRLSVDDAIFRAEGIYNALATAPASRHVTSSSWVGLSSRQRRNSRALASALYENLDGNRRSSDMSDDKALPTTKKGKRGSSMLVENSFCRTFVLATHKARKGVHVPYILRSYSETDTNADIRNRQDDTSGISLLDVARIAVSSRGSYESVKIRGRPGTYRNAEPRQDSVLEAYHEVCGLHHDGLQCLLSIGREDGAAIGKSDLEQQVQDDHSHFYELLCPGSKVEGAGGLDKVRRMANKFCEANESKIQRWARNLVFYRRTRSPTAGWKRFAGMQLVDMRSFDEKSVSTSDSGSRS